MEILGKIKKMGEGKNIKLYGTLYTPVSAASRFGWIILVLAGGTGRVAGVPGRARNGSNSVPRHVMRGWNTPHLLLHNLTITIIGVYQVNDQNQNKKKKDQVQLQEK